MNLREVVSCIRVHLGVTNWPSTLSGSSFYPIKMNITSTDVNSQVLNHMNFLNSQSTQGFNGCSAPRIFIPCKNLKLAMDPSSPARQFCKSVDSDFEKLNLHHRVLSMDESPQMDCVDMSKDVEIKTESGTTVNGVVKFRMKKQRTELSSSRDDLTKERPMSWEGELSDSEIMKQNSEVNSGHIDEDRDIKKDNPGSPMAVGENLENDINSNEIPSDLSIVSILQNIISFI